MSTKILERKILEELDEEQVDDFLKSRLGIGQTELAIIRSSASMKQRVIEAANLLKNSLSKKGLNNEQISLEMTEESLAYLIGGEKHRTVITNIPRTLRTIYSRQADRLEEEYGYGISKIHFLREELGIYSGDLHQAMRRWPKVRFSDFDLQRNVKIPLGIGELEAIFIGLFYGDGNLFSKDERGSRNMITMYGTEKDSIFYEREVIPVINYLFNLHVELKPIRDSSYNLPGIEFKSLAVFTWIHNYLEFPISRKKFVIKDFEYEDAIAWNVFKGLIASEGVIPSRTDDIIMGISNKNNRYLASIKKLAERFGIESSYHPRGEHYWLVFPTRQLIKMLEKDGIIHPYHKQRISALMAA